jgi:hypothetical protein
MVMSNFTSSRCLLPATMRASASLICRLRSESVLTSLTLTTQSLARAAGQLFIRPSPPVCAPLEIERRGPRRSLLVLRHRSETRRSRPLWFAQGALRFGGPSAPTCTQQKGRREGESRGRPGTIVRCRLFPEPRCESPQSAVYTESTLPAYLRTAFAPRFFDRAADFIQRERPSLRHESELA